MDRFLTYPGTLSPGDGRSANDASFSQQPQTEQQQQHSVWMHHNNHDVDRSNAVYHHNDNHNHAYSMSLQHEPIHWHLNDLYNHGPLDDGANDDDDSTDDGAGADGHVSPRQVLARIELLVASVLKALDRKMAPILVEEQHAHCSCQHDDDLDPGNCAGAAIVAATSRGLIVKRFSNVAQSRSFTSILLVLQFCHALLRSGIDNNNSTPKTTTTREVYYYWVTHFRSQRECDAAIVEAARLLDVPRHALGLHASPRGWFCGDVQLIHAQDNTQGQQLGRRRRQRRQPHSSNSNINNSTDTSTVWDGRRLQSVLGSPIGSEWLQSPSQRTFSIHTHAAVAIVVIEKEGVYRRLAEDRIFDRVPCILVTGRGFPDWATRALVHAMHTSLQLPVWGLADCNPFGVMVLQTYARGSSSNRRYTVPMQWMGLRPLQIPHLIPSVPSMVGGVLPPQVFQSLTSLDRKRLEQHLLLSTEDDDPSETDPDDHHAYQEHGTAILRGGGGAWIHAAVHPWHRQRRLAELVAMRSAKVELEALHWLGMDFLSAWVQQLLLYNHHGSSNSSSSSNNNHHVQSPPPYHQQQQQQQSGDHASKQRVIEWMEIL